MSTVMRLRIGSISRTVPPIRESFLLGRGRAAIRGSTISLFVSGKVFTVGIVAGSTTPGSCFAGSFDSAAGGFCDFCALFEPADGDCWLGADCATPSPLATERMIRAERSRFIKTEHLVATWMQSCCLGLDVPPAARPQPTAKGRAFATYNLSCC